MANVNIFNLAADGSQKLLPILQAQPLLASKQDEHGYSLVHAAASYNHLDLLRSLIKEFHVDPNLKDEDGETALFVVETVEAAQLLLEELHADAAIKNSEGMTAEEKIRSEGEFTTIADFLRESRSRGADPINNDGTTSTGDDSTTEKIPPLPPNIQMQLGTLEDEQDLGEVADPLLRQRIEELASRGDFQSDQSQQELRELITDAVRGTAPDEQNKRPRVN